MPVINSYPACCGASIFTGFNGGPKSKVTLPGRYDYATRKMKPGEITTAGEQILKTIDSGYKNRFYSCILTVTQYRNWGKWLKANGFQFTHKFINSVHNSTLYHFVYIAKTEKSKIKHNTEPPKGWEEYPGPTPDAESSNDKAIVQPAEVTVAA